LVLTAWVPGRPNLVWRTPPLSGGRIRCQSYHDDYVCSRGVVSMSGDDGADSSTRLLAARRAWVLVVMSYLV
jgi:hypothetical protein